MEHCRWSRNMQIEANDFVLLLGMAPGTRRGTCRHVGGGSTGPNLTVRRVERQCLRMLAEVAQAGRGLRSARNVSCPAF